MADLPEDTHREQNTSEGSAGVVLDTIKATVEQLKDKKLLIRERALQALTDYLLHVTDEQEKSAIGTYLLRQVENMAESSSWEQRQAAFWIAKAVVETNFDNTMHRSVQRAIKAHLQDVEPRVRLAVAELLEELCKSHGVGVWTAMQNEVLAAIEDNFVRDDVSDVLEEDRELGTIKKTHLRHDTEGWKALETAVKTLLRIIRGVGRDFIPHLTPRLLNLVYQCLTHKNRYVRETAFHICAAICDIADTNTLDSFGLVMAPQLVNGLLDDWSQVAYAACVALRSLMMAAKPNPTKYYPITIPALCFARHHPAEGVKHFALEAWRDVVETNGRALLAMYAKETSEFYVSQTKQDNDSLREGACWSIGELAAKVDLNSVAPFAHDLFEAIVESLKDHSWPVADAACSALAALILSFPDEVSNFFEQILDNLSHCLSHFVWSVRENAAIALGNILRTQPPQLTTFILEKLRADLLKVLEQEPDEHIDPSIEDRFGPNAKSSRDNNKRLHTGQQIFSCECHSKNHEPGCLNHNSDASVPIEPWHRTDGAVYLLREVSEILPSAAAELLPELATAAAAKPIFAHYAVLKRNIWQQLPLILKNVGIKAAKEIFPRFLPSLIESLEDDNQLLATHAAQCLHELMQLLGEDVVALPPKNAHMVKFHVQRSQRHPSIPTIPH